MSMMIHISKGGEFYASNIVQRALWSAWRNSSRLQHWSITGAFSMLVVVAARLFERPSRSACPSDSSQREHFPHEHMYRIPDYQEKVA